MLKQLRLENFAIISSCELSFKENLTILTGETGAGKSILVNALSYLLGKASSEEFIRTGSDQALIEGIFEVPEPLRKGVLKEILTEQSELIIYRLIRRNKPSVIRVNNQTMSLKNLKVLTQDLALIVGQHEQFRLFDTQHQLSLVDHYGDIRHSKEYGLYASRYEHYQHLRSLLNASNIAPEDINQKLDFLMFQIKDISDYNFERDEEEELKRQKKEFQESKRLKDNTHKIEQALSAASEQQRLAKIELDKLDIPDSLTTISEGLEASSLALEESYFKFSKWKQSLQNISTTDLNQIESRLDEIFSITLKYNKPALPFVLDHLDAIKEEHQTLTEIQERSKTIQEDIKLAFSDLEEAASKLHLKRVQAAKKLSKEIETHLQELEFQQSKFSVLIQFSLDSLSKTGCDTCSFDMSPNLGEPLYPIHKMASGGELSRVLLALYYILFDKETQQCMIFDEVDSGIGGLTGNTIGNYLQKIAQKHQVICITHLAQIAQCANDHIRIEKNVYKDQTFTKFNVLDQQQRTEEIKRMLGGQKVLAQIQT